MRSWPLPALRARRLELGQRAPAGRHVVDVQDREMYSTLRMRAATS